MLTNLKMWEQQNARHLVLEVSRNAKLRRRFQGEYSEYRNMSSLTSKHGHIEEIGKYSCSDDFLVRIYESSIRVSSFIRNIPIEISNFLPPYHSQNLLILGI